MDPPACFLGSKHSSGTLPGTGKKDAQQLSVSGSSTAPVTASPTAESLTVSGSSAAPVVASPSAKPLPVASPTAEPLSVAGSSTAPVVAFPSAKPLSVAGSSTAPAVPSPTAEPLSVAGTSTAPVGEQDAVSPPALFDAWFYEDCDDDLPFADCAKPSYISELEVKMEKSEDTLLEFLKKEGKSEKISQVLAELRVDPNRKVQTMKRAAGMLHKILY